MATFAAVRKLPRHPAHPAYTPARTPAPDPHATLVRLVAVPVPLADLPAIAQAAGIKRSVAQTTLNAGLRAGTVTLRCIGGVACVVAMEGGA